MIKNIKNPKIIALELTSRCNLICKHCRGTSTNIKKDNELTKEEIFNLLDQLSKYEKSIIILTGGEPLLIDWIFDVIKYGNSKKLIMTLATNGTLITENIATKLKESGIKRVSISIDGDSKIHDYLRSTKGSFDRAILGIQQLKKKDIEFQINTTVSKLNINKLDETHQFAINLNAVAHHFFFLVQTGRANELNDYELSPTEYKESLIWIYNESNKKKIHIHPTCAPQYYGMKYMLDKKKYINKKFNDYDNNINSISKGCSCGNSFVFISSIGEVNPCGYLPISTGNIRDKSFQEIWENSIIFNKLRNTKNYNGKCRNCKYNLFCGGCRARAYALTGDYLSSEPCFFYETELK